MLLPEVKFGTLSLRTPGLYSVKLNSAQAAEWLGVNTNNRRVRRTLVEYLKRQIATGEWQDNHPQPIVFSDAGRMIDGQHRTIAIAESQLDDEHGVFVRVETGASDAIREYLDTGITRTLEDRVQLHEDRKINKLAAQLVTVSVSIVHKSSKYGKATPEDAKEFFETHCDAIMFVASVHKRERGVGVTSVALAAMEYYELDHMKAEEFYADLFIPAGEVQQSQMLRDWLLKASSVNAGGGLLRQESYAKAIGCMKAHLDGRLVKKVVRASSW